MRFSVAPGSDGLAPAWSFSAGLFLCWNWWPTFSSRGGSTRFLLEGESDGKPAWIDNQFFPYRFFSERLARAPLPIVALRKPQPGTLRVCLLGGSEVMGAPDPSFGLGRQLEFMLREPLSRTTPSK